MDPAEIDAIATAVTEKIKAPDESPIANKETFDMISFKVIEGRMSVIVKAPSGLYYLGRVADWREIPSLAGAM